MLRLPPISDQGTHHQTVRSSHQGQPAAMDWLVAPAQQRRSSFVRMKNWLGNYKRRRRLVQEGLVYSKALARQLVHSKAQEGQLVHSQVLAVVATR